METWRNANVIPWPSAIEIFPCSRVQPFVVVNFKSHAAHHLGAVVSCMVYRRFVSVVMLLSGQMISEGHYHGVYFELRPSE